MRVAARIELAKERITLENGPQLAFCKPDGFGD
jgi:hypothetical protein